MGLTPCAFESSSSTGLLVIDGVIMLICTAVKGLGFGSAFRFLLGAAKTLEAVYEKRAVREMACAWKRGSDKCTMQQ